MESCIYRGAVRHRRFEPKSHEFRYRLFMLYLDLDELDVAFEGRWLWSVERRNLASFRRSDYLGDPAIPLRRAVLDRVESELGRRPVGPVRMLTHVRYLGYCFNPVTIYYCFDASGEVVDAIVAEITNTPWGERHSYVLDGASAPRSGNDTLRFEFAKAFHVSPFMGMDHDYDWRFSSPTDRLLAHMENRHDGTTWFDATMTMERRELTGTALASTLLRHPFMTGKVLAAIYWQALRLWLKRMPFHDHPKHTAATASTGDRP